MNDDMKVYIAILKKSNGQTKTVKVLANSEEKAKKVAMYGEDEKTSLEKVTPEE